MCVLYQQVSSVALASVTILTICMTQLSTRRATRPIRPDNSLTSSLARSWRQRTLNYILRQTKLTTKIVDSLVDIVGVHFG